MSKSEQKAPTSLGQRLSDLRERRGWTQKELAERAGISVTFLSEVENDRRNVGSATLLKIADALRASLDYLMRGEEDRSTARTPSVIPPELAEAAEEQGWTYSQTSALLKTQSLIVARRGGSGDSQRPVRQWTKAQWIDLFERLFGAA